MLNRKRETGFTLMEILIVIALISVISVFAIPGIMSWMPDYRLKSAIRDARSNFQKAKLAAIRERANCAFEIVDGGYIVYVDSIVINQKLDDGEQVIAEVNWAEDYKGDVEFDSETFADNGDGNGWIAFQPNGLPRNPSGALGMGTLTLKNGKGNTFDIIVSRAGNIRTHADWIDEDIQ